MGKAPEYMKIFMNHWLANLAVKVSPFVSATAKLMFIISFPDLFICIYAQHPVRTSLASKLF